MAAKKTVKKSRTSGKKSNNKSIMRWWYVLPVIAIVAVAGYAIVRFSEASNQVIIAAVNRGRKGFRGGVGTINKTNGQTVMRAGDNAFTSVYADLTAQEVRDARKICARVAVGNGGGGYVKIRIPSAGPLGTKDEIRYLSNQSGWKDYCFTITNNDKLRASTGATGKFVEIRKGNSTGDVLVDKVFGTR